MADSNAKEISKLGEEQEDLARIVRSEDATSQEKTEARAKINELSKQAGEMRKKEIDNIKDPKEKQIVELYESGEQNYAIAQKVFDGMVNSETVGRVIAVTRKHYANDYREVEEVNDYKGYVGV